MHFPYLSHSDYLWLIILRPMHLYPGAGCQSASLAAFGLPSIKMQHVPLFANDLHNAKLQANDLFSFQQAYWILRLACKSSLCTC